MTEELKKAAALKAAEEIRSGMMLGLGTGSTVYYLVQHLGELAAAGLQIHATATSRATEDLARQNGIPLVDIEKVREIDLAIDGVDAIDPAYQAVKGGGGALFREKVIATRAKRVIWIMDERKLMPHLSHVPLPVETAPFGYHFTEKEIKDLGFIPELRTRDGEIFTTDNGNYILDLAGNADMDYRIMAHKLKEITGILETGFFSPICEKIIVGTKNGVIVKTKER